MSNTATTTSQEILDLIQRRGVIPTFRTGTVYASSSTTGRVMVLLDSDAAPVPAANYAGTLTAGMRVLAVTVPPHGLCVVGNASTPPNPTAALLAKQGPIVTDSTTSATYVDMTDGANVSFTKRRADTRIKVDFRMGCFLTGVGNTRPSYAVRINGVDYEVVTQMVNPTSTHTTLSSIRYISSIAAGAYTVQARWLRAAGTGTIVRNADDWITLEVSETF